MKGSDIKSGPFFVEVRFSVSRNRLSCRGNAVRIGLACLHLSLTQIARPRASPNAVSLFSHPFASLWLAALSGFGNIAASSSFASPLFHPAHLLVMGPGRYTFMDHVKIGESMALVAMAVSTRLLPIL